jgi:hypothetical protein
MQRKARVRVFALATFLAAMLAAFAWFFVPDRDRMFRGKPESEWITNIVYGLSDEENKAQAQRWRDFGPEGLRVLERGLQLSRGYHYRKLYRRYALKFPRLSSFLPLPTMDTSAGTRLSVLNLLCTMEKDGWPAWRGAARALADENDGVRQTAMNFFTWREDDSPVLNRMPLRDKKAILPLFVRPLDSTGNWGPRYGACVALRYYPEEKEVVVPALGKALGDREPSVRLCAAESLNRIDAAAASRAGVVKVLAALVVNPNEQIAGHAASALRNCRDDADEAVGALLKGLQSTNTYVTLSAISSLEAFPSHADTILPELRKAAEGTNGAPGRARQAVKNIESRQRR